MNIYAVSQVTFYHNLIWYLRVGIWCYSRSQFTCYVMLIYAVYCVVRDHFLHKTQKLVGVGNITLKYITCDIDG